jgi:hypothetical protein
MATPATGLLDQSDDIRCNNINFLRFKDKKQNDTMFCMRMNGCTVPKEPKNIDNESKLWRGSRGANCSLPYYLTRGGNSKKCPTPVTETRKDAIVGYDNFESAYSLNNYLMVPCKQNTFRNYVQCDNEKCCSIRHQLFMNVTRRV